MGLQREYIPTKVVVREICKLFNINQSRTSPYHPEVNGQCERMHISIINLLRVLCSEEKSKWPIHLQKMIHAYNIMPHATTGFSKIKLSLDVKKNYQLI